MTTPTEVHLEHARSAHHTQMENNKQLKKLLADWKVFAADVQPGDAAGADWLDDLKARTDAALNR